MPARIARGPFRTYIKAPGARDKKPFLSAMQASAGLHHPWVSAPRDNVGWNRYMKRVNRDTEAGFLVRRIDDDVICGVVNLNVITFEALCSAYVSYFGVVGLVERGYMKEGLAQVTHFAFDELGLHRLEANIQPENTASIALVKSVGFRYEGFSPRFLKISGVWRDHERWAILADGDQEEH